MSRRRRMVTQADVASALKGAIAAGIEIDRYEIDEKQGRIIVFPKKQSANEMESQESLAALI